MALTPQQILDRLTAILPAFAEYWESDATCFRDDGGAFTHCGVFADCAVFVRDRYDFEGYLAGDALAFYRRFQGG
jgi:hypothetical protein